jgi:hypothetical protein
MIRTLPALGLALTLALALTTGFAGRAPAQSATARKPSTPGARVYVISPADGAPVASPVTVRFGLAGMGIAPAGVDRTGTGHHHLLIDTDLPSLDVPLPADAHHVHFGGGQTETVLDLAPGKHTLQLVLADDRHIPHDPPLVSERIEIQVR